MKLNSDGRMDNNGDEVPELVNKIRVLETLHGVVMLVPAGGQGLGIGC